MKKEKSILLFLALMIVLSLGVGAVNTATINTGNRIDGKQTDFNITFIGVADSTTLVNCSLSMISSSTANSSVGLLFNLSNASATIGNGSTINYTLAVGDILEDARDYTATATCWNSSTIPFTATASNLLVDRGTPSPATAVTFTNPIATDGTITATVIGANTTACFIRFGGTSVERRAMTLSGSTCTFTVGMNSPPNSDYQTFIEASDGTNTSLSTAQNVIIRAVTSDGGGLFGGTLVTTSGQSVGGNPFLPKKNDKLGLGFVLIIIGYLYYKNKK